MTAVAGRRAVIDQALRDCPAGKWIAVNDLFRQMRVTRFLSDMIHRATRLQDKGAARLIECADAALATLIANDSRTRPYCLLAGDRWLAVPADVETRFRTALRKVGYSLARA